MKNTNDHESDHRHRIVLDVVCQCHDSVSVPAGTGKRSWNFSCHSITSEDPSVQINLPGAVWHVVENRCSDLFLDHTQNDIVVLLSSSTSASLSKRISTITDKTKGVIVRVSSQ